MDFIIRLVGICSISLIVAFLLFAIFYGMQEVSRREQAFRVACEAASGQTLEPYRSEFICIAKSAYIKIEIK